MFATFKMNLPSFTGDDFKEFYGKGLQLYSDQKQKIHQSLDDYLSPNGTLKASEIEKVWFPSIDADVFLSHSRKDEKQVIAFAGFLKDLGITSFIDSCVWGYANDLLKDIDDTYCVQSVKDNGGHTYDYESRNYSTAHVHMILNGALHKMIDSTECLIFLDTPNSLRVEDLKTGTTDSCWIYSELLASSMIQKKQPIRKGISRSINESFEHSALSVEYDVDITHLIKISFRDIDQAAKQCKTVGVNVLDQLYWNKKLYEG